MVGRKNVINLIIIVIALILIVGIALRFYAAEERTLNFSGPNVYRAVYVFDAMQKQGYSVDLKFSGRWTDSGVVVNSQGLILEGELGRFTILLDGREVTVGGPFSSADDIQATGLSLVPAHKAVVKVGIEPQEFTSLKTFNSLVENFGNSVVTSRNIYDVGVEGDITLDVADTIKPTLIQDLNNVLRPGNEYVLFERGLILKLKNANAGDLRNIEQLFAGKGIKVEKGATSRIILYLRTKETPAESRDILQKRAENSGVKLFLFKVITKPVQ